MLGLHIPPPWWAYMPALDPGDLSHPPPVYPAYPWGLMGRPPYVALSRGTYKLPMGAHKRPPPDTTVGTLGSWASQCPTVARISSPWGSSHGDGNSSSRWEQPRLLRDHGGYVLTGRKVNKHYTEEGSSPPPPALPQLKEGTLQPD